MTRWNRRQFLTAVGTLPCVGMTARLANATGPENAPENDESAPVLRLVHYCDPQLGFGPEGYDGDRDRLFKGVEMINRLRPDAVLFAGDLVNIVLDSPADMQEAIRRLEAPVLVAPGNHDIPDPVTTESLERFRNYYGPDRSAVEINGWKIIVLNTQLWRETELVTEREDQEKWLDAELAAGKEKGTPMIVASHIPPYIGNRQEEDEYYNLPKKDGKREELLNKMTENGVKFWLAGHSHTTLMRATNNLVILNAEPTSRNFDSRPYGFRLLSLDATGLKYRWEFFPIV